jgi:diacylglycerol kinase family enzyme
LNLPRVTSYGITYLQLEEKMAKASKAPKRKLGLILINSGAGTVKSLGVEKVRDVVEAAIAEHKLPFKLKIIEGDAINATLTQAIKDGASAIAVGGGDGTVSSIAQRLAGTSIPLAVLPLGTMNLFARAAGMPDTLEEALKALKHTEVCDIDLGSVNERTFLRQISFGLQPKIVRMREKLGYRSRLTKMLSGLRASIGALADPSRLRILASVDGKPRAFKCPALVVTNNLYGKGHTPFQDRLDEGVLGLYVVKTVALIPALSIVKDMASGNWQDSPHVDTDRAKAIEIRKFSSRFQRRAMATVSVDGELETYNLPIRIEIRPKVLKLLKPMTAS